MAILDYLKTLKNYYSKPEDHQPVISQRTAAALSILFTLIYVLPFYLSSQTRPSPSLSRDSPSVIRARVRSVTLSCVLCTFITIYILRTYAHASILQTLTLLGWYPISVLNIGKSLLLTALLFAGPIFEKGFVDSEWREWIRGRTLVESLSSWSGWRNYVAGPATEEILFRSLIIPITLLSHPSVSHLVFVTPLYFGLAHIHHFYEFKLINPRTPLLPALAVSLFQFGFTSVFGWYAAFLFLRTGSLGAVIAVHSFCNWMGLPRLWGRVGADAIESIGDPRLAGNLKIIDQERELHALTTEIVMGEGTGNGSASATHNYTRTVNRPLSLKWSVAYYVLLVGGAFAFWKEFWVLTRSDRGLISWEGR